MSDPKPKAWYPVAAYLYMLHLDGPALAWEYLRRHPGYRRAWAQRSFLHEAGGDWGLRLMEDPSLDAREAQPSWLPGQVGIVRLLADDDPASKSAVFSFWDIPGRRQLFHDGRRLQLTTRWPGGHRRLELDMQLNDGSAYLLAVHADAPVSLLLRHARALADPDAVNVHVRQVLASPRPTAPALLEMLTLQTLDAVLAGASQREIAIGLFGRQVVADGWHADSDLRARVRRLVRRGRELMDGGYRRLARTE
ncbi:hypothetical protein SAMN05428989_2962 [Pseudoxanthomonas sp. GM95]|uniref:DUF7011 domain-containing protein n=1 Tax=Pseudoxanthomonas sp. GM95 TaxID=1881043 RepID=UPI0008D5B891|nr:DUF2285 domain-containing protein [Pseudoxanthomonas sp. GM95]SEL95046.1 hypothetical protein SAMN05428989_2962 [Pseudoxanthomonas sp. GM95]